MISKKKRVTKELFLSVLKNGKILSSPLFLLRYTPSLESLCAVVVPKSLVKRAVKRNSLRRKGYNAIRILTLPPATLLFFYKKEGINASSEEIRQDLEMLISKIRL